MNLGFASFSRIFVVAATVVLSCQLPAISQDNPDFTKGQDIPQTSTKDWNLGPTGLRGWMYCNKFETTDARQVKITKVDKGSPADNVINVNDVLLGVGGSEFSYDPRTEIGKAITEAEASDGKLDFIVWRDGKTSTATVELEVLGPYKATAPFKCPKSGKIYLAGCEALAEKMAATEKRGNPIERSLNALALLSTGDDKYLPLIRKEVEWASKYSDLERRSLHSWWYGYVNILMAEYVLATGDQTYVPALERITLEIANGQSEVGSWGHKFIQKNGRLSGYGMMNAPGIPLTISMILGRKAGVSDPKVDEAINKSTKLLRFYVGKGSIPYGDHAPWIQTHDDNGKNGGAAVLFNQLGEADAAEYFSRMSVASYGGERDEGHTGNFFNVFWAMPGVALSGPEATGAWLEEFGWYYDLARRWDYSFVHLGPPQSRPDSYGRWDASGAYLLAYSMPLKKLYITGKNPSTITQVDATTAAKLIADGQGWSHKYRTAAFDKRSNDELVEGLKSWSPILRLRSAAALAKRGDYPVQKLVQMLNDSSVDARIGACDALAAYRGNAAAAVPALRETLQSEELWLRIKAAEALAAIGQPATPAIPDLLNMLAVGETADDPRGMVQRYLTFSLFNRRGGLLGNSLDGVDRDLLFEAVRAGLANQDGRARGSFESVYRNLSFEELKPLLPAIHQAILEPAPSGIMFADGIRLSGLNLLAKHRIAEGIPLCITLIDLDRWGSGGRVKRCLDCLESYGGAAKSELPRLKQLQKDMVAKRWKEDKIKQSGIVRVIETIEKDTNPEPVRSLSDFSS